MRTNEPTHGRAARHDRVPRRRRPDAPTRWRQAVGGAVVALALPALASAAAGQGSGAADPGQAGEPPLGALLPDDRLSPALAGFAVEGASYAAAYDAWAGTLRDIAEARRSVARNQALVAQFAAERAALRAQLDDRRALMRGVVYELDGLDLAMSQLVVSSYTRGGPIGQAAAMFDVGAVTDELYTQTLERDIGNDQLRRRSSLRGEVARLQEEIGSLTARLGDLADRSVEPQAAIEDDTARAARLVSRVPALERGLRDARLTATIVGTDLPLVALDAYVRAAARLATEKPRCAVQWNTIAALGRIESRHGNVNGATLRPDGRTTVPIIGIALTGEGGTALVGDTDDGRLDGDADLDRAVGPMQFIPSTWTSFRRDGNGDGVSDPQSIYDAALATGGYLCASGKPLSSTDNLRDAYFAYNRSTSYVNTALDNAERYRKLVFPPPPKLP